MDLRPVHVALPTPLWQEFTYLAPKTIPMGTVVHVSFGSRLLWGILWKDVVPYPHSQNMPLKTIQSIHGLLTFSPTLMQWMESVARYMVCPLGMLVKMTLPPAIKYAEMDLLKAEEHLPHTSDTQDHQDHRSNTLDHTALDPHYRGTLRQWARHQGVSLAHTRSLVRNNLLLVTDHTPLLSLTHPPVMMREPLTLNPEQTKALESLRAQLTSFSAVLLEGVTGSGKTEVLLTLSQHFLDQGKQVLILLPEIMLSYAWCQRIQKYFDLSFTLWHSGMSPRMRQDGFEDIITGRTRLIIGARSALGLPYANLGLMVVDEEHEMAYKQSDALCYHGRDMAVLRGAKENIPVILASATPSMETRWNVLQGRYGHVRLHHRYGGAELPVFSCIDMRPHPPKETAWISGLLRKNIQETLDKGEQTLLFLNRRGYACLWMCYRCGYRAACHQCSTWLTGHETPPQLLCHYCGSHIPIPKACPGCGDEDGLLLMGPGIERIAKEVLDVFPQARTCLISSDHVTSSDAMKGILDRIAQREIDILIGTQLIAKGYHFPYLTCIGIIDTDFALNDMDFRANERLFQLLYQVAGRAGREHRPGKVFLQTLQPDYPLFQQMRTYDWDYFVDQEIQQRRLLECPPITRLIAVIISHKQDWAAQDMAMTLQKRCPHHPNIQIFGPAPAPLNPLRGRYRWRFLLKTQSKAPVYHVLKQWLYGIPLPSGVEVHIDRDPYSLL